MIETPPGTLRVNSTLRGAAFDLDGTLLRDDRTVLPQMSPLFARLMEQGIWITLASARPPRSVRAIAKALNLPGPYVALNGAVVVDENGRCLALVEMRRDLVERLVNRYREDARVSVNVYTGQEWFAGPLDERIRAEAGAVGFEPKELPATEALAEVAKILLMVDLDGVGEILTELLPYGDELHIATSGPGYIEITDKSATKGHGLEVAARTQGFGIADMLVAGDGHNDVPMVSAAGYGIAMGHGPEVLREAATEVVGSNHDGSLAVAVEDVFRRG